jgi:hypothetical protein
MFLTMLLKPFAEHFRSFDVPSGFFLLLVFLTLIYAFRHDRRRSACLILLAVVSITLRFAADHWNLSSFETGSQVATFITMVLVMIAILSEVLRARSASPDLVVGAVCLYFVIGLAWMFLYYTMYVLWPGSIFVSPSPGTVVGKEAKFTELLYFSFSALSTIGSSGEESVTTLARQLAVVESATGQLYLAVLVSRLVGFSTAGETRT